MRENNHEDGFLESYLICTIALYVVLALFGGLFYYGITNHLPSLKTVAIITLGYVLIALYLFFKICNKFFGECVAIASIIFYLYFTVTDYLVKSMMM